jgi:flagellar hook-associated protein 2
MGTVGLSFGSPTSGAGFDVSSTVAEIVGNLQNVETPWKNQLTTLESQDAAISNLGSLLSSVSTDISQLTDFEGVLAQKEGSSSDTGVLELTAASSSAAAGTHTVIVNNLAQTSSGYLAEIANGSDTLSGSVTLQVGNGTAQTINLDSADNTLSGLASAINASGIGITANVLTDANGSRLSLVSGTSGANGNIVVSNNSLTAAASNTLSATVTAGSGSNASTALLSAVAGSGEQLNNTGTLNVTVGSGSQQSISMSAVNTAEGGTTLTDLENYINDPSNSFGFTASIVNNSDGTVSLQLTSGTAGSSGTLAVTSSFVDPATALGYTSTVAGSNASLTVDGVNLSSASNTVSNLIPGVTFQLLAPSAKESDGSLEQVQVVISNDNTGVESVVNQFVSDYNSLISAVNAQEGNTSSGTPQPLFGSPTLSLLQQELLSGINSGNPNGSLDPVSSSGGTTLSGSMTIKAGSGTIYTFEVGAGASSGNTYYTGSGQDSLADLASTINAAGIGITAAVITSGGQSSLTFTSETSGSSGALSATSAIEASTPAALQFTDSGYTSTTADSGTLGEAGASDTLGGSFTVQVGGGVAQTIDMGAVASSEGGTTLADLGQYIANNSSTLGFTASLVSNNDGSESLSLTSNGIGSASALNVTSNLYDASNATSTKLNYTNSSDINSLTALGISVNNDGSLTFDADALDSVLNTDYASVVGFFQNASGWGQSYSNMLTNAGSSSSTGILSLAANADSTIESTLNADISKEQSYISEQQSSLTTELNQANEVLQELPSQLQGMNELYSAITGYNQNTGG